MTRVVVHLLALTLATSACDSDAGGDPGGGDPSTPEAFEPAPAVMPRLTASQYRNSLVDLFGEDLPPTNVEPDTNPYLFYSIGATTTELSELGAQQYADAAAAATDAIFSDSQRRDAILDCTPFGPTDTCVESILVRLGRRLFRRPITADELARWKDVVVDTSDGDVHRGLRLALYGMLQSPHFVYRIELGEADPDNPDVRRYTSHEMAQRLSFLLWNTAPDLDLLDAAERGELDTAEGLHMHAARLMESPRARVAVQEFFTQYLDLGRLDNVDRDPERYPAYTDTLAQSMRIEIQLLVDDLVFRQDADIRELYATRKTFVNTELANLYGVDAADASPIAFAPVELPADGPRAGLLTLGGFLAMNAHPTETSPTLRGKFVRERVLCQNVPPPPGDIDLNLDPDSQEFKTLRERLEQHREDPQCAGCHAFMDPPGFLFESFDSIGAFRTQVDGYDLDTTGDLDGVPLAGARELAEVLRYNDQVGACIVRQLYRHANGRLEATTEEPMLDHLSSRFAATDYRFKDLLIELIVSDGFRTIAASEVSQ